MHQPTRLCLLITGITYSLTTEINPKPFGIPLLISWQRGGRSFAPTGRVILGSKHKTLRQVAEQFRADYLAMFGRPLGLVKCVQIG